MVSHFVRLRGDVPYQEEIKGEDCAFYVVSMGENNAESMKDMTSSSSSINRDLGEKITPSLLALRMPLAADLHADMTIFSEDQYLNSMNEEHCMLYELCEDARNFGNDCGFYAVMQSVKVRLVECLSSGLRGDKGRAGARALIILQALLLYGPEAALSLSLELFDILRAMCIVKASPHSCIESIDAFDFMDNGVTPEFLEKDIKTFSRSYGGASDCVKIEAAAVLVLLLDKTSLAVKRNLRKNVPWHGYGRYASTYGRITQDSPLRLPFAELHSSMRPKGLVTGKPCSLILRRSLRGNHEDGMDVESEDDDVSDEDKLGASYTILAEANFQSPPQSIWAPDDTFLTPTKLREENTDNLKDIEAKMVALYKAHLPEKVASVSLLMTKYKGREHEMLSKLEERLGAAQTLESEENPSSRTIAERSQKLACTNYFACYGC